MIDPYTTTKDGYTRSGVECGCALMYNLALGIPTLHPCGEPHALLLQGGGRTSYVRQIKEDQDSIEIGTPAKGGAVKVYHQADDPGGWKRKLDSAFQARAYAQTLLDSEAKP